MNEVDLKGLLWRLRVDPWLIIRLFDSSKPWFTRYELVAEVWRIHIELVIASQPIVLTILLLFIIMISNIVRVGGVPSMGFPALLLLLSLNSLF